MNTRRKQSKLGHALHDSSVLSFPTGVHIGIEMIDGTATVENSPMIPANSNILLIGLDSDTRRALSHLLEAKDFKVHWVQTGEEAMNALRQQKFGAAFLELRWPETDDLTLLTTLAKAQPVASGIPGPFATPRSHKRCCASA